MTMSTLSPDSTISADPAEPYQLPVVDLYSDIHKGIRAELFSITSKAGNLDPGDRADRAGLHQHIVSMAGVLESHAHHEDVVIDPVLAEHLPDLAERIRDDHERIERWFARLVERADEFVSAGHVDQRRVGHLLHLDLAEFTGAYLTHQDVEERVVMPALERVVGVDATGAMLAAIVGSIPPDEMAQSLSFMLPAMNVLDRVELLSGIRAGAPAPVFDGILSLARSVLVPSDFAAMTARIELG